MKSKLLFVAVVIFAATSMVLYSGNKEGDKMDLKVTSQSFSEGGKIPVKYTCDGKDISPPLSWSGGPDNTRSYAIISDDPDAPVGTWVHWVIYNIPADVTSLPEDVPKAEKLENGAVQGRNDFKKYGYGGPCPPGGTHRYFFKVYALDTMIDEGPGLTKKQLLKAMEGHILAQGELMGKYSR